MNGQPRLWFGVFITLVFIAGVATGSLLERVFSPRTVPAIGGGVPLGVNGMPAPSLTVARGGPLIGPMPEALAMTFARELDLDEAQRRKIEAIFESRRQEMGEIRDTVRDRMEQQRRALDAEIERVLTPAQQKKFHALNERIRAPGVPPDVFFRTAPGPSPATVTPAVPATPVQP